MNKAIFCDRDGVITKLVDRGLRKTAPWEESEVVFYPKINESVGEAHEMGYSFHVISNQPDLQSGELSVDLLTYIDSILRNDFNIDSVNYSFDRGSWNYKPNPGMVLDVANRYDINLQASWLIGDTWKDCVCAKLAKVKYIHVGPEDPIGDYLYKVEDLWTAVDMINAITKGWKV